MSGLRVWVSEHVRAIRSADQAKEPLPAYGRDYFGYLRDRFGHSPPGRGDGPARQALDDLIRATETRPPTWGDLFALDLGLLRLLDDDEAALRAPDLRAKLRSILGDAGYETVMGTAAPAAKPDHAALRRELEYVVSEIHKAYALTGARETNRNRLMFDVIVLTLGYIVFLFVVLGVAKLIDGYYHNRAHSEVIYTAFAAAVLGSIGGYVSLQSRLQSLPYEGDAVFRMIAVNKGWLSIYLAPVSGSIFAVLAYLLFAAQLIKGDLLPEFKRYDEKEAAALGQGIKSLANLRMNDMYDYPKLFLWSFLVGFGERYVPDALSRVVQGRRDQLLGMISPAPPAAPGGSQPPHPDPAGPAPQARPAEPGNA